MQTLSLFQQYPWLFIGCSLLLGLIIGSFLNVVIYRLPRMMEQSWQQDYQAYFQPGNVTAPARYNLAVPRSACPHCGTQIKAIDNIPVISWLLLKGRCRYCHHAISPRYPLVEIFTALISAVISWHYGPTLTTLVVLIISWGLISLVFIDIDKMLVPDQITLPLLWLALLFSISGSAFVNSQQAIVGAATGYLTLWTLYWAFKLLTGKEGMGYGDFKLLAIFGALLGWQQLPLLLLLASITGIVAGAVQLAMQGQHGKLKHPPRIPFAPYLIVAGWISLFWGKQITGAYLSYIGV
ncbi:prepilin peptidase [Chromatiaceae bacterium AAb-1]|nr:prepilin peptidase [Chromatiaceae bacterium AAb-1]